MKFAHIILSAIAAALIMLLPSCSSKRDFVYLSDMNVEQAYPAMQRTAAIVHPDDRISILVSCKRPELAAPFNASNSDSDQAAGYKVSAAGDIEMPILGTLHVAGMTLDQVKELVKQRLIEGNYIKDPIVTAEYTNFKYSVLGAVGSTGIKKVDGDRITLLEAIAAAGDLASNARPDRVMVIREEPDGRKMYVHDIRSTDIFSSPCFYLQQNDVVYVEPDKKPSDNKKEARAWQITTVALSLASVVTSIIWATNQD